MNGIRRQAMRSSIGIALTGAMLLICAQTIAETHVHDPAVEAACIACAASVDDALPVSHAPPTFAASPCETSGHAAPQLPDAYLVRPPWARAPPTA